ncbi:unnamed protein product [marine sediment metagenome]|uniref:tRNA dimethylallyltransferase n=1 Tax=marine sediment metagenome TaxID=412755 RepID=X1AB81_9ZZZZ
MSQLPPIIFLFGPTASGKTDCALALCEKFPLEIISVDSAMVYQDMNIGTAKPSPDILAKTPHHLIDIIKPNEIYSVANFYEAANQHIKAIHAKGKIPLLVGGTMMYFKALEQGIAALPEKNNQVREKLILEAEQFGLQQLHQRLKNVDPISASRIHENDPQRILRALEIYEISKKPMSAYLSEQASQQPAYVIHKFALNFSDRAVLHQRIEQRFDLMLSAGFIDEVIKIQASYQCDASMPSMRTVGYRQALAYLNDQCSKAEMREKAIIATRQLAKRQLTWLRSWPDVNWYETNKYQSLMQAVAAIGAKHCK